ncbi:bifunctional riboflavin kinase/FAD synthetase [Paenibacillus daejeonensis]|uniref:bifunctional riboflavin kinase/FAD synthetase n=1 Tax=Paenibacillus daejeonensis TaxID=135193 RepID=UPI00036B17CF|nr:bifunctional riboflavin kinase/FAD synthetase [Paenibacillus daejeonensis]
MKIIELSYPLTDQQLENCALPQTLAIGHFDGVHRGHQQVIQKAVEAARADGLCPSIMTFHPHPREVLSQEEPYLTYLTPLDDKMALFASLGVEVAYVFRFDLTFAAVEPVRFVEEVLVPLQVQRAVVGFDFSFGHRGEGKAETLRELGKGRMEVEIVSPFHQNDEKVSSTLIRKELALGAVDHAESLLGRPYRFSGIVQTGDGRGRTIGFPTANVHLVHPYVLPRLGVYAVRATSGETTFAGVMNLGFKPTFNAPGGAPTAEVHLFDYSGDLYGKELQVSFCHFIREERKFGSVDELIAQIATDANTARQLLGLVSL